MPPEMECLSGPQAGQLPFDAHEMKRPRGPRKVHSQEEGCTGHEQGGVPLQVGGAAHQWIEGVDQAKGPREEGGGCLNSITKQLL